MKHEPNDPRAPIFYVMLPDGATWSRRATLRQARNDRKDAPAGARILCGGHTVCPGCGQPVTARLNECICE